MYNDAQNSFEHLRKWCEKEQFRGWDACDGTLSPILTRTPLGKSAFMRFAFMQATGFRVGIFNFRRILFVPKKYNAKGVALLLNAYCNIGDRERIVELAELLISIRSEGYSGAAWGYPFGWQGRLNFWFPPNTPTVVATAFAVEALFNAYEVTKEERYRDIALSAADFVLKDLHRTHQQCGFLFSYSSLQGNDVVHNASLLGARILAQCYKYGGNKELLAIAKEAVEGTIMYQAENGSWAYGLEPHQGWIDNFHTGYNLEALQMYEECSGDTSYRNNIERGFRFFIENFFEEDGTPKYYHNNRYPIDIHCCGEIFVLLSKLHQWDECRPLADKVLRFTLENMQSRRGYFYFQKRRLITTRTPLMRWSEAFMMNALSYYLMNNAGR